MNEQNIDFLESIRDIFYSFDVEDIDDKTMNVIIRALQYRDPYVIEEALDGEDI